MTATFPRLHFLYPKLDLPFLVELKVDDPQITLRTWRLSADAPVSNLMPVEEAAGLLGPHAAPFTLNMDPLGETQSGRDLWIPAAALGGQLQAGERTQNLYMKPVCQTGFAIDPAKLGAGAWSDHAQWMFNVKNNGLLELPYNRYLATFDSKMNRQMLMMTRQERNLLTLWVPFAGDSFAHCSFALKYNPALGCVHNMPDVQLAVPQDIDWDSADLQPLFGVKAMLPSLRLTGPATLAAGASAAFTVEMFDCNTDITVTGQPARIWLDASAGYLAQRQVQIADGLAAVTLTALGLQAGDAITLKAGWRNFSGAAEKTIAIV